MAKKLLVLSLIIALLILSAQIPNVSANSQSDFQIDENGVLTKYTGSDCDVVIPDVVTSIGEFAFENCSGLTSIKIPDGVTTIGENAFANCNGLASILIPKSVTSIGEAAFWGCKDLNSINVDTNNSYYSSVSGVVFDKAKTTLILYPAGKTDSIYTIPNGVTKIEDSAFTTCTNLTTVTIPNSVTSIGDYAFESCQSLSLITIPSSVTSIGFAVFPDCLNLRVNIDANNPNYSSISGVIFNKKQTTLVLYPAGKIDSSYIIPNTVTTIGKYAFFACYKLSSIIIPNSVTSIDENAFDSCISLTSIAIPDSVTSIGESAFCGSALTSIILPNSVTSIADWTFVCCDNLISVTIPNSVTSIGNAAFESCPALTSVTIPNSVTSIGWEAFDSCSSLKSILIPSSVTYIGDAAFYLADNVTIYCSSDYIKTYAASWNKPVLPLITVSINGNVITTLQPPIMQNDRILVPLRAIFESLGVTVNWNDSTQTIIANKDNTTITIQIGSIDLNINGDVTTLDVPAQIINDSTMVPARAVAEAFGSTVHWDDNTQTVEITEQN